MRNAWVLACYYRERKITREINTSTLILGCGESRVGELLHDPLPTARKHLDKKFKPFHSYLL